MVVPGDKVIFCFVHAPNTDGWSGELVLALFKRKGKFRLVDIQTIIRELYPDDDPDDFHYDQNVPADKIDQYVSRKEQGKMQRRSIVGSNEEMYQDEWEKGMRKKYPDLFFLYNPKKEEEENGN